MGSIARQSAAERFIGEFGEELVALAKKDRGHDVFIAYDEDGNVRYWVKVDDFEYMSESVLYNGDCDFLEDLSDMLGLLGLEETDDNRETLRVRLRKADL